MTISSSTLLVPQKISARCGRMTKALPLLLLLTGSAVAQKVQTESDPAVDFSKFRTFAIRSGRLNSRNPALNNDIVKTRLETDIQSALQAKGLTPVTSGSPDLNVRYTLGTPRKVETEIYPAGWRGWGSQVVKVPYTEGALVIDLRDPSRKALVWRAIVRQDQKDASKLESKLDGMVRKAIDKYPPKAK